MVALNRLCLASAVPFGYGHLRPNDLEGRLICVVLDGRRTPEASGNSIIVNAPDAVFGLTPPSSPASPCSFTFPAIPALTVNSWTQTDQELGNHCHLCQGRCCGSKPSEDHEETTTAEGKAAMGVCSEWQTVDELLDSVAEELSRKAEQHPEREETLPPPASCSHRPCDVAMLPNWWSIVFKAIYIFAKLYLKKWLQRALIPRPV